MASDQAKKCKVNSFLFILVFALIKFAPIIRDICVFPNHNQKIIDFKACSILFLITNINSCCLFSCFCVLFTSSKRSRHFAKDRDSFFCSVAVCLIIACFLKLRPTSCSLSDFASCSSCSRLAIS